MGVKEDGNIEIYRLLSLPDWRLKEVRGWLSRKDVEFLMENAKSVSPGGVVVEIGVFEGLSSSIIAFCCAGKNPPIKHYCIDLWKPEATSLPNMKKEDVLHKFIENMGNSRYFLFTADSTEAARWFENMSVDFLFLDGDHGYPKVWEDIRAWWPKIKTNGLFSGHDFENSEGVRKSVGEFENMSGRTVDIKGEIWWIRK